VALQRPRSELLVEAFPREPRDERRVDLQRDPALLGQPLTAGQVEQIAHTIVARVADRLRTERGIELEVDDALTARLARDGFDEAFGARPLQRHVRRTLEKELTRAILAGELTDGQHVRASEGDDDGTNTLSVLEPARVAA